MKAQIAKLIAYFRAKQLYKMAENPFTTQQKVFESLMKGAKGTAFAKDFRFEEIKTIKDFQARVPVRDYEQNKAYFDRMYKGEADVAWKGKPLYLCKTSGTTSGAKYIPITQASISNQIAGARDILLMYIHNTSNADFLNGKMMFLSGSPELETNAYGVKIGRLSGIVNHFVPAYLQTNKVPGYDTNCIEDWEQKVAQIAKETSDKDLRLISGIPPWVQMYFEEIARQTGKKPLDIWKNLSVFIHGGVDFNPYRPLFETIFANSGRKQPDILELFPASEGFFAIQDKPDDEGLLLLTGNGVFYEFIALEEYGKTDAKRLTLGEVDLEKQYALIISTNAGLWAYDLGDTVKFVSLSPYKIRVSGRVKHFLSLFGEHIISEEVNKAIQVATEKTGAQVQEFTVVPFLSEVQGQSYHEWLIEFSEEPQNLSLFIQSLDESLRKQNTYYNDLREGNMLILPKITLLQKGACRDYMKSIGKLGGQNKFARLSNNRDLAVGLTKWAKG